MLLDAFPRSFDLALSRGEHCDHFFDNLGGVGKSACADVAAGEPAFFGADEAVAEGLEFLDVFTGDGIGPHAVVHGGGEGDGAGGGADHEGDEVVTEAVRDFSDDIGGGGGDEHEIGALGEADVLWVRAFDEIEGAGADFAAPKGQKTGRNCQISRG